MTVYLFGNEADRLRVEKILALVGSSAKAKQYPGEKIWRWYLPVVDRSVLSSFGLGSPTQAALKMIPDSLFGYDEQTKAGLVQGLWDSDGYTGRTITFGTVSRHLQQGLSRLLTELGIDHSCYDSYYRTRLKKDGRQSFAVYVKVGAHEKFKERIYPILRPRESRCPRIKR